MKKDRTITSYRLQYAVIDNSTKSEKEEAELYDFVQKFTDNHGLFSDWPIDHVRAEMRNFFRGKDRLVAALLEIRSAGRRSVVGSISVYPISVPGLRLPSKLAYRPDAAEHFVETRINLAAEKIESGELQKKRAREREQLKARRGAPS